MKILLTGSAGFIGTALKELFKKEGIELVEYDIKDDSKNDTRDFEAVKEKIKGVDGVIHLAAVSRVKVAYENPLECVNTNIGGTINVLEAARLGGSPWVIFASSREVFGESRPLPATEETPLRPMNVYGIAKVAGEELCKTYSKDYGLKTRVLRFSNVYTSKNDQLDRVIPKFILEAAGGKDIMINGTGQEIFDFTYINDTVQGIWGCVQEIQKSEQPYDDFTLSTGRPTSLQQLAETVVKATDSRSKIKYSEGRSYDVSKFYADSAKAKRILGFNPSTTLEEGIAAVVKKFKEDGVI